MCPSFGRRNGVSPSYLLYPRRSVYRKRMERIEVQIFTVNSMRTLNNGLLWVRHIPRPFH